jgi:holo-[acyl-carrier protein] synthase
MCDRLGTDIVSVARIESIIRDQGERFLRRWFTSAEIDYCAAKAAPARHFAARLAAKEAVLKALSWTWEGPVPFRSVEVVHDERGAPAVRLHGELAGWAADGGVDTIRVSLSHCDEFATAVAAIPAVRPVSAGQLTTGTTQQAPG